MNGAAKNSDLSIGKIFQGICIVIVASCFLWLCNSTVSHGSRLAVIESQYTAIDKALERLESDNKTDRQILEEIRGKMP